MTLQKEDEREDFSNFIREASIAIEKDYIGSVQDPSNLNASSVSIYSLPLNFIGQPLHYVKVDLSAWLVNEDE